MRCKQVQPGLSIVTRITRRSRHGRPIVLAVYAITALSLAQEPAPDFEGHLRLGQYFLEKDAAGRAVSEFETAIRLAPERAETHITTWGMRCGCGEIHQERRRRSARRSRSNPVSPRPTSFSDCFLEIESGPNISAYPNSKPPSLRNQTIPRRISTSESSTGKEATPNELWQRFAALRKRTLNPPSTVSGSGKLSLIWIKWRRRSPS